MANAPHLVEIVDLRAVRHLLRHLGDRDALLQNELVAHRWELYRRDVDAPWYDEVLGWIRRCVDAVAQTGMPSAQLEREILARCDLDGLKHNRAIRELGLSRGAFYYHRRRALERFAHLLSVVSPRSPARARQLDEFELVLAKGRLLAASGQGVAAESTFQRAVTIAATTAARARSLAAQLTCQMETGSSADPLRTLQTLDKTTDALAGSRNAAEVAAWVEGVAVTAATRWRLFGAPASPYVALRECVAVARKTASNDEQWMGEARIKALLHYADAATVWGALDEALTALEAAQTIERTMVDVDPGLRVRRSIVHALLLLSSDRPVAEAVSRATDALDVSTRYGLDAHALDASAALATIEATRGHNHAALRVLQCATNVAIGLGPHEAATYFFLRAARAYAANGAMEPAWTMLAHADAQVPSSVAMSATFDFSRATVMLAAGDAGEAARIAGDSIRTAERFDLKRMAGRALGVRARALATLARSREAQVCADDAVALLEYRGARHLLLSAYELSATLTGRRAHAKRAAELRSTFNALEKPARERAP